jgi:hypothetical protein
VAPILGAPFFAMIGIHWVALVMLYLGMGLGILATVLYVRAGLAELRARGSSREGDDPSRPRGPKLSS